MTMTRGSRQGVSKRCRPEAVLRPGQHWRVRIRPPSKLTRTRWPFNGPSEGIGIAAAVAKAASRKVIWVCAVAWATRCKVDHSTSRPRSASNTSASW